MICHQRNTNLPFPSHLRKIVLAGNPNVGKSVVFNTLTGLYVDVSNFPGTTLEINYGQVGTDCIIDTPGIYGVSSFNDEERVARDIILSADIVINVVDAVHLDRDLFLTQQLIDMGLPVVVALNMVDEAAREGIKVDHERLAQLLGVPVVPTVAIKGQGIEELKKAVASARPGRPLPELEEMLAPLLPKVHNRAEALLILEGDPWIAACHRLRPMDKREEIYLLRRRWVDEIVAAVVQEDMSQASLRSMLSKWMLRPLTGIPILLGVLYILYQFIGVFIAQTVVEITEERIMQGYYQPFIEKLLSPLLGQGPLSTLLIGEFGLLTMTVTYILGLLLPLVVGFYLSLSVLEDSGYLPRIAVLVDRVLMKLGMNGKGVIPIILGTGCVTAATITTRMLNTPRERTIATFLLAMTVPCSAQLGVIASMLAPLGVRYVIAYVGLILIIFVAAGTVVNRMLPGEPSDLFLELPPLRWPQAQNVLKKTYTKVALFLREATPLFAAGALLLGLLQVTGLLEVIQALLAPLTVSWLKLPKEAATAFIMGFIRRDFGAAGLYSLPLTPKQTLVALVTITIFVPCIASALVILKERGVREALVIWFSVLVSAFLIGGILAHIMI
ncbi:MAG: ferrous iron transport protein B [Thermanaeromonas sp.]|uniref:ferrous iron transport protein B n=1 Tax=Thermanaeromonas sp. TaxID=2003697 RepID=UPI00243FEC9F|nr:ferrous iron transport protein B [Thermanaeromonas sp.]MCG0277299.1 ferrous iron transport protein B [Thermanaeromonas sp.]